MSKIDELIAEFCPNGVEYFELQDVFEIKNGYTPSKKVSEYWTNGTIPWFRMEDIRKNGRILSSSIQRVSQTAVKGGRLFPAGSIIMATTATIGEHALLTADSLANQQFTFLTRKVNCLNKLDEKFVFYYCFVLAEWCKMNINVSGFASVDMGGFKKFQFPIPPLEVQKEIVNILDKFTQLEAELEAELEARRKQYEYYRNQLVTFNHDDIRWAAMGEVLSLKAGKFISASKIHSEHSDEYPYPCFGGNGLRGHVSESNHEGDYVLIGRQGAWSGNIKRVTGKFYATEHAVVVTPIDDFNISWLFHLLTMMNLNQYVSQGAQPGLAVSTLNKIPIPIPSIKEQERVVSILDKFDALVNDISEGLPAEINARRKQYEYYRTKLLTFEELPA